MSGSTGDNRFGVFYEHVERKKEPTDQLGLYDILTKGEDGRSWDYDTDKSEDIVTHLPATNTVFINANIALTDGTSKTFSGDIPPRTIPNLYDALQALSSRISELYTIIEAQSTDSTVDKWVYVTNPKTEQGASTSSIVIQPGTNEAKDHTSASTGVDESITNVTIKDGAGNTEISIDSADGISIKGKDIVFKLTGTTSREFHLGAIIEAIQELNRRTAFIDSTMPFDKAVNTHDVHDYIVSGSPLYTTYDDGLPAAADCIIDGAIVGEETPADQAATTSLDEPEVQTGDGTRSILNDKLKTMKIIAYDPNTNETIDITDKNISLNGLPLQNNDDYNTFITPDTATVIMRGCPYLLS